MSTGRNPLVERFGLEPSDVRLSEGAPPVHRQLAGRGSVRRFQTQVISKHTLRRLCALALCAPTKSDLQTLIHVGFVWSIRRSIEPTRLGPFIVGCLYRKPRPVERESESGKLIR